MDSEEMKQRTKQFAINVGILTQSFPESQINRAYCNQIIRSSSSVGANYRASRRAKSNADFINKLKIVEEELDESLFFLELLEVFNQIHKEKITALHAEFIKNNCCFNNLIPKIKRPYIVLRKSYI